MLFEWDPDKNEANLEKHGVSLKEAKVIWEQEHLETESIAYSLDDENRNATVGWIGEEIYVAIWTWREDRIRLISVRRARSYEKEIFIKRLQDQQGNG